MYHSVVFLYYFWGISIWQDCRLWLCQSLVIYLWGLSKRQHCKQWLLQIQYFDITYRLRYLFRWFVHIVWKLKIVPPAVLKIRFWPKNPSVKVSADLPSGYIWEMFCWQLHIQVMTVLIQEQVLPMSKYLQFDIWRPLKTWGFVVARSGMKYSSIVIID